MYRIDFYNTREARHDSIKVHTLRTAEVVLKTLRDNGYMYQDVRVAKIQRTRFREIVILVQP